MATSFGIVIGKEIFGGVGMNIFNPALMARAFLYFTYPADISGDKVWALAPDGYSGPTALSIPAGQVNANAIDLLDKASMNLAFDYSWINMFMGWIPGSIGETNKWLIMLGALFLILVGIKMLFSIKPINTPNTKDPNMLTKRIAKGISKKMKCFKVLLER